MIELIDTVEDESGVFLIFPHIESTLDKEIYSADYKYTSERTKDILHMLLTGIKYIHDNHIIHRDIKPTNILVNDLGSIKICDFGLATQYKDNQQVLMEKCGTIAYMAPEMHLKLGYGIKADVWSIGCILAELQLKDLLLSLASEDANEPIQMIFSIFGTPTHEIW